MKKILSLVIAAAMLLSLAVVMSVPAAAVDGEWIVYSKADHEKPDYEGDPMSIPGYEYNDDGLHVIPADWRDFKPGAGVQRLDHPVSDFHIFGVGQVSLIQMGQNVGDAAGGLEGR